MKLVIYYLILHASNIYPHIDIILSIFYYIYIKPYNILYGKIGNNTWNILWVKNYVINIHIHIFTYKIPKVIKFENLIFFLKNKKSKIMIVKY